MHYDLSLIPKRGIANDVGTRSHGFPSPRILDVPDGILYLEYNRIEARASVCILGQKVLNDGTNRHTTNRTGVSYKIRAQIKQQATRPVSR